MELTKQCFLLATMLHQVFSDHLGIFCDTLDDLPSISAPYLSMYVLMCEVSDHVLLIERSLAISCVLFLEYV
jgi:hypothetical protein